MKNRINTLLIAGLTALSSIAVEPSDLIIYINPGHGGYDSDDRVITIHPFADGDTATFAESKSNLGKGFRLRELLLEKGYNVVMSRVTNTTADDLGLTTIGRLANEAGSDLFLSIHSNATGTANRVNFPIIFFRGYDDQPVYPEAKVWATEIDKHLLTNNATIWTSTSQNVRGDWSFQPSWGTQGYGVLRALTIPGALSEGSFHDYTPETYRLLSNHYYWVEGWNFSKAVNEHFGISGVDYGGIAGRVTDERVLREGDYKMYDDDVYATVNSGVVELWDATGTTKIEECVTDDIYNGMYSFRRVTPGTYKLKYSSPIHYAGECDVTVEADKITYVNPKLKKIRNTPPVVLSYSPKWEEGQDSVLCNEPIVFEFNWDMDVATTEAAFSIEPAVEGSFRWEDSNYRMIFTPNDTYEISTEYTVKLNTTAQHAGGMTMENPVEFSFVTTNRNYMEITGQFPNEGDLVHYDNAAIEVRFDKFPNVLPILNQVKCTDSTGATVGLYKRNMKYSKTGDEYGYFRIPFTKDLTIGETYTLELSHEIADNDGITLKDGVSIKFTAVDAGVEKTDPSIETMEDATLYDVNEDGCANLNSSKVTLATGLFNKCISFEYEFAATDGGEALWLRSSVAESGATSLDALGVHVYGDLTGNEVYLQMISDTDVKYVKLCDMTFLGWRYIVVPLTALEGDKVYRLSGVKLTQNASIISRKGTVMLDNINYIANGAGVENVLAENTKLTVYPNPASEYLIGSTDGIIDGIELVSMNGQVVASVGGNVLNVSEVAEGSYIARIYTAGSVAVRKVTVIH